MRSLKGYLNKADGKGPSLRSKASPVNHTKTVLAMGYLAFLRKYSTKERPTDKNRHQKVKITSTDKFEDCILQIAEQNAESKQSGKKHLFCAPVDGVDEVLSAYSNLALKLPGTYAILFDINTYKTEYFTFRLFLTQLSETKEEYLRNLFFYLKGEGDEGVQQILDKIPRNNATRELHRDYLIQLLKKKLPEQAAEFRRYITKGVNILNLVREETVHYKSLAKKMKQNLLLNFNTHWLSDDKLYETVRDACRKNMIKLMRTDMNRAGKNVILNIINDSRIDAAVLYMPKGKKKFAESKELVQKFRLCIGTRPPQNKREKFRVWTIIETERFFSTPQFQHQGELSSKQLMILTEDYKERTDIRKECGEVCSIMLMGDIPFGRLYLDERSKNFARKIQEYANRYKVRHIALCGDILDGEHTREKRKLAFLQYLSDEPQPSIEHQCRMASEFVSRFNGKVYSVTSDGDWDIIEEKQRELINQKEFQYKIEKNTSHIPDNVRKSLRVEAMFEAAKEYYDYVERQIGLSERIGDSLTLGFDTANVHISHMSIGQYFRKSLARSVGVKEQQIINQFLALHDFDMDSDIHIKVSSHDNVLQAHMETDKTLNLKIPSLESSTQYENIPIQLRNAVQDMMHKAFSVRGKIPFLSSCKVEVTEDKRILLTIINEKILDMLEKYKNSPAEEYLIYMLTDVHVGSIAHRYDYFIKYMDYVKYQAEKLHNKPNMRKVGRIALFNGDIIEGINYPTAMMRNASTKLTFPQTQMSCAIEMMKPFFFSEKNGQLRIDEDIEHIVITHGNHEYNSGFIHSGMMATEALLQYFKAHMEREYPPETVRKKLMYSLFVKIDQNKKIC